MNKYRRLLGSPRGTHFKEPKKKNKSSRRRQTVKFRPRYAKSLVSEWGTHLWMWGRVILIIGTAAWASMMAYHFATESNLFKIKDIVYEGEVPATLKNFLPFTKGQNVFSLSIPDWERKAKERYKEIKEISIQRRPTGNLVVQVENRLPVGLLFQDEKWWGVDEEGVTFPINLEGPVPERQLPTLESFNRSERKKLCLFLELLKTDYPDFHQQIKSLSFHDESMIVRLVNGIVIDWGDFDEKNIFDKAQNILRLLSQYRPVKVPAMLRFVTMDRIVMDSHWSSLMSK